MAGYFSTISAKLDLDITDFEKGLARSTASVEKVGAAFEHRLLGPRHLATALATAFGLNIEKIGESFASLWTGVTEQSKKYYESIAELSTKAADKQIEQMRRELDAAKQLALLQLDLQRLRAGGGDRAEKVGPTLAEKAMTIGGARNPLYLIGIQMQQARLKENELAAQEALNKNKIKELEIIESIADKEKEVRDAARKEFDDYFKQMDIEDKDAAEQIKKQKEITAEKEKQAKLTDAIGNAAVNQNQAENALGAEKRDRSSSTLAELAGSHTAPGRVQAREIQRLEARAKRRRASGLGDADADTNRALELRKGLGALGSKEQDPLAAARDKVAEASKDYLKAIDEKLKSTSVGSGGGGGRPGQH